MKLGQLLLLALALLLGVHVRQGNCGAITNALVSPAAVPGQTFTLSYTVTFSDCGYNCWTRVDSQEFAPHATADLSCSSEIIPPEYFKCNSTTCIYRKPLPEGTSIVVTSSQSYSLPTDFEPLQGNEVLVTLHETTLAPAVELAVNAAPQFSLATTFSSFPSSVTPGGILSFNVELYNSGPSMLSSDGLVCFFSVVPESVLVVAASSSETCAVVNGFLRCALSAAINASSADVVEASLKLKPDLRQTVSISTINCTNSKGILVDFTEETVSVSTRVLDISLTTAPSEESVTSVRAGEASYSALVFGISNSGRSSSLGTSCVWEFPRDVSVPSSQGCNEPVLMDGVQQVSCPMDVPPGDNARNMLIRVDAASTLTRLPYSMLCTDENGQAVPLFEGSLSVETYASNMDIEVEWLNPPSVNNNDTKRGGPAALRAESSNGSEGGTDLKFEVEMKSAGPSWARGVICRLRFLRMDGGASLATSDFSSSLPCEEHAEQSATKEVTCTIGDVSTIEITQFNFSLVTEETLGNISISFHVESDTTNSFPSTSFIAIYDPISGAVYYVTPDDSGSSQTSTSRDDSNSSTSSHSDQDNKDEEGDEEDSARLAILLPSIIGGVGTLFIVMLLGLLLLLRKRRQAQRKRFATDTDVEMEDVYAFKEDVQHGDKHLSAATNTGDYPKASVAWEIPFEELEFEEEVGKGAFSVVWKGSWRDSEVAIKQLNIKRAEDIEAFKAEADLMKRLRPHANVVALMGVCIEPGRPYCLITEFLPQGNLRRFLRSKPGKAELKNSKTFIRMAKEIAAAMNHLHSEGITHRDLAARNVLLTRDLSLKVADFGLSQEQRELGIDNLETNNPLPLKWMAPECLTSQVFSRKSDVWSYGVTLWEMANKGKDPYPDKTSIEAAVAIASGETPSIPSHAPEVIQDVMQQCFQHNPEDRPTFKDILHLLKQSQK
ncbi:ptk6 protein tyrosine kinase [Balamuthia mandrillaris]